MNPHDMTSTFAVFVMLGTQQFIILLWNLYDAKLCINNLVGKSNWQFNVRTCKGVECSYEQHVYMSVNYGAKTGVE